MEYKELIHHSKQIARFWHYDQLCLKGYFRKFGVKPPKTKLTLKGEIEVAKGFERLKKQVRDAERQRTDNSATSGHSQAGTRHKA